MSDDTTSRWKLPQIIEIENAIPVSDELRRLNAENRPLVVLDIEDVVAVDTAALQLLVSFVNTVQARGGRIEWENLSVPLYQSACVLDLQDMLAL